MSSFSLQTLQLQRLPITLVSTYYTFALPDLLHGYFGHCKAATQRAWQTWCLNTGLNWTDTGLQAADTNIKRNSAVHSRV